MSVELVVDARATLGEGAIWHDGRLVWVDIEGRKVHLHDPSGAGDRTFQLDSRVGTVVPRRTGGLVLALENSIALLDTASGRVTSLVENPKPGEEVHRFNDGKCDSEGRLYVGTIAGPGQAGLYRIDTDRTSRRILSGVTCSNGLVWDAGKGLLHYVDTPTGRIDTFDWEAATGEICGRRTAVKVPEEMGMPDGMTADREGNLWVALWGGGAVGCWNPLTGKLLEKLEVPAPNVTSCAFGGPDMEQIYITTARAGTEEERLRKFPLAGGLFRAKTGAKGMAAVAFAG